MGLDIIPKYETTISAMAALPVMAINVPVDQRNYATGARATIQFGFRQNSSDLL